MTDQPAAPTPGPYTTDPDFLHEVVLGADGVMVADCNILPRDENINRANARLFAASWATAAERDRLVKVNEGLVKALEALLRETELAGNANADDYGWPTVIPQARAALDEARK